MGKYAERNLQKDERIVIEAKFNKLRFLPHIIMMIIFVAIAIAGIIIFKKLGIDYNLHELQLYLYIISYAIIVLTVLIFILLTIFKNLASELTVTNKRVIGKRGLVAIKSTDLHIDKVSSIEISTTFFGRIFNYYRLMIKSTGDGSSVRWAGATNTFIGIANANEIKNAVNAAIEQHAEEARRAQAEQMAAAMRMSGMTPDGTNKY